MISIGKKKEGEESKEEEEVRINVKAGGINSISGVISLSRDSDASVLSVSYTPESKAEGAYMMSVLIEGQQVAGSPFEIELRKS